MADVPAETGRAVVTETFRLSAGRRHVLVFNEFEGILPRDGLVSNGSRWIAYSGPEFLHGPGGRSAVAVMVAEQEADGFAAASCLTFVPAPPSTGAATLAPRTVALPPSSD